MSESLPLPEKISRLFDAVYPSFAMLAAMQLDLFSFLNSGPLSAKQLAAAAGVPSGKLGPLLYSLVLAGLMRVEDGLFSNSAEADQYLVRGKPGYVGGVRDLTLSNWTRMLKIAETIQAGGPPEMLDYRAPSHEEMVALFRGLYPGAVADARMLMTHYDFASRETLLDVGGGSGAVAIAVARANPHLEATVLELPSVAPTTRQFIDDARMGDRVTVLVGDAIHDSLNGSYDVVVARHLTQVLSEEECRILLTNLATVLTPGGVIHLVGWVLDDSRLSPQNIVGYNLILLTAYQNGQAYTEQEYREWFSAAGYEAFERVVLPDGSSIVTAKKPE